MKDMRETTTREGLARREKTYRALVAKSELGRHDRNHAVRQAVLDGWTHAQIADATGLTRARVGQIALERPGPERAEVKRGRSS